MKKTLITLLAAINVCAYANPVSVEGGGYGDYEMIKTWERCLVAVGEKTSQVSCAVGYKIRNSPSSGRGAAGYIGLRLPVYYVDKPPAKAPLLEVDGILYTTKRPPILLVKPDELQAVGLSAERRIAMFEYSVRIGQNKTGIAVVATYEQPSIEGTFRYLPLFEDGHRKRQVKEFSLTAFPIRADGRILLLSEHPDTRACLNTRISIEPEHQREIVIRATEANKSE